MHKENQQDGKTVVLGVFISDTIEFIMALLQKKEGVNPDYHQLRFAHRCLRNERTLSSYGIRLESVLLLGSKSYRKNYIQEHFVLLRHNMEWVMHTMCNAHI